jgi:hypothetical protein
VDESKNLPPVTQLAMVSLSLLVAAGIYMAANISGAASLTLPVVLLACSTLLLVINFALLSRAKDFDWAGFFAVAKWALVAYAVISGVILYTFLHDGLSGDPLAVLTAALVLFALHVPLLIGFTVARFGDTDDRS